MIKILLVDDQKIVQELLKNNLDRKSGIEIVDVANNGEIAIERTQSLKPDVVLMDIEMPVMDGLTATKIITEKFLETKVLILSSYDEDTYLNKALQVGAKGYLLKTTPSEELIQAIHSVHKNYFQLGPGLLEKYLYKLVTSQTNSSDIEQIRLMLEKQSKLLEELQNRSSSNKQKIKEDTDVFERQYFLLSREVYSLKQAQEQLKQQINLFQGLFIFIIVALAATASASLLFIF
ncbi:response regulator transcription factor [Candidatus Gracilibacteria bacterium]|nr:response regulator transcription factor [Candidatus Gracilibacteria bacterium]NJM88264.1 response regulator transcription factor [Hydrococcus sp. RU_2_2]NJP19234.1 response regulator transcription factor [Hydrococcus sp. CRU_1_1]